MPTMNVLDGPHSGTMSLPSGPPRLMGLINFRAPTQIRSLWPFGLCREAESGEQFGLFGETRPGFIHRRPWTVWGLLLDSVGTPPIGDPRIINMLGQLSPGLCRDRL
jgi:hypothetical protein